MSSGIEGTLFKWTNYWGGWQARWFVLHSGILSYYNSSDEVSKGCRASIKISASDIVAYPADNTRLDVVVPNEQRWYLKASNAAERQAWLIALGTSKANTGKEEGQQGQGSSGAHAELRSTMNEVRLFCDLLVQQAVKVKEESLKSNPDATALSDSSVLLSTTCDTFLAALGRCIDISDTSFGVPSSHNQMQRPPLHDGQFALPQISHSKTKHKKLRHRSLGQSPPTTPVYSGGSGVRLTPSNPTQPPLNEVVGPSSTTSVQSSSSGSHIDDKKATMKHPPANSNTSIPGRSVTHVEALDGETLEGESFNIPVDDEETMLTFFSGMLHSFSDIVLQEDGGIPTPSFLAACEGIVPFLDTIGSTAFAPVRMDFMGNISKLKTKHSSNITKYQTLQKILEQEIKSSATKVRNSATDALMWLKRGLRFMQKFLLIFKDGERNLTLALNQAYSATLKPYHGWVVKGIFALAVKAAPYPNDFIKALARDPDHAEDRRFVGILLDDIDQYTTAMDVVLNIIDNFYESHQLESSAIV